MYEGGLSYMRYSVSDTAEWGDYKSGPRIVTDETRATMKQILAEIQSGAFAEEWMDEYHGGAKNAAHHPDREQDLQLEAGGQGLAPHDDFPGRQRGVATRRNRATVICRFYSSGAALFTAVASTASRPTEFVT